MVQNELNFNSCLPRAFAGLHLQTSDESLSAGSLTVPFLWDCISYEYFKPRRQHGQAIITGKYLPRLEPLSLTKAVTGFWHGKGEDK